MVEAQSGDSRWVGRLRHALSVIEPGLGFEVRKRPDGLRSAFVLPLDGPALLPLARLFLERAPDRWPWTFHVARPAMELEAALDVVRADTHFDLSAARVRVGVGRGHLLDIVLGSHHVTSSMDDAATDAAERLVALLLGDDVVGTWVDTISVTTAPRPSPLRVVGHEQAALPLALGELAASVERAISAITLSLPEHPCHLYCERAEWTMFEFPGDGTAERHGEEPPGSEATDPTLLAPADDLQMASTMCPEMLKCFLSGSLFVSSRFSRHGEHFCYLRMTLGGPPEARVQRRVAIEEALDRALVPGRLGCVVGSGIGSEYTYILLALCRLTASIPLVRQRLRALDVARDSWLLFCDSQWQSEWLGVFDDTAAPEWALHSQTMGTVS